MSYAIKYKPLGQKESYVSLLSGKELHVVNDMPKAMQFDTRDNALEYMVDIISAYQSSHDNLLDNHLYLSQILAFSVIKSTIYKLEDIAIS